jgi:hypothetical protein
MGLYAKQIRLRSIEIKNDDTFVYHYDAGSFMRRFLAKDPLWVRYEGSVNDIPPGIAAIPFVAIVSQMIWFHDGILDIPELDKTYAESMDKVKAVYQKQHPETCLAGRVNIGKKTSAVWHDYERKAAFFTGGVDSMATALRHREENPLLISIWGSEARVYREKAWQAVNTPQIVAALEMGLPRTVIASNYHDIFQEWALNFCFPGRMHRSWYVEIAYGAIFLGLSAPVTWREGVGAIYIASSNTAENWPPDGSYPELIEKTRWAGTQAIYDIPNEDRWTKLERVVTAIRGPFPGLQLNVCALGKDEGNCSRCDKCSITMAGLALMGIEPSKHGFVMAADTPQRIRRALERNEWRVPVGAQPSSLKFWRETQENVSPYRRTALPPWHEFFDWFSGFDVNRLIWKPSRWRREEIKNILKPWLPFPVFLAIRLLNSMQRWKTRLRAQDN